MNTVEVAVIRNFADYKKALARINKIYNADPMSDEFFELKFLAQLMEEFESKNYPIPEPDPIEMIIFLLQQNGIKKHMLTGVIGVPKTISFILNRRTTLTIPMMYNLYRYFRIRPDILIKKYIYW